MELSLYKLSGGKARPTESSGRITVSDKLFAARANKDLVYQVATSQMSNKRRIIAHTKTRSEVSGGGKKPWQQKGTGHARHGSIRSPIWVGGGVAHGPSKDVNFKKKITKSAARQALAAVLSARVSEGHLAVIDAFVIASGKTKDAVKSLKEATGAFKDYRAGQRILMVLSGSPQDAATRRAVSNLQHIAAIRASDLNALTVLGFPYVIATADAVEIAQKTFVK